MPRTFLRLTGRWLIVLAGVFCLLWSCAWLLRPNVQPRPVSYTPAAAAAAIASRDLKFDPHHLPTLHVNADVKPTGESPLLADLVKAGKLPPLAERMPTEPTVMTGKDGVGTYGGTWLNLAISADDVSIVSYRMTGPYLARWSPLGYPIEPHIAKAIEPSADLKTWTVKLRPGMKWSDGEPFTADDIMYWWEGEITNPVLKNPPPPWMMVNGKAGRVEKANDYEVRFVFGDPYPLFMETLAMFKDMCETPKHYLKQYHPDPAIGDAAVIERDKITYKIPSARSLYGYIKGWQNPQHPRLWPWVYRTFRGDPPQVFVRNPYYFVVDTAGNQLPYIDRLQYDVQDGKLLALSAANGGVSMQGRHMKFSDYTELMTRSQSAGTRVLHWYPAVRSNWVINPNLNRRVSDDEPDSKFKAELLSDKHFRQALSLAINRKRIITADQAGIGEPSQVEPGPESPFHSEKLAKAFIDYDPKCASDMLDALGLTQRDSEGFRTFRDGSRMVWYLDITSYTGAGAAQFVVDDWQAVGIRTVYRERARSLFYVEKDSMAFDFNVWSGESDFMPLLSPRYFIPYNTESFYAVGWARWYTRGGYYDTPESKIPGCIPVPKDHPMYAAITAYEQAIRATDKAEQKKFVQQMTDIAAENLWTINIATPPPAPFVVSQDLKNVPDLAMFGNLFATPSNAGPETYWFANPKMSQGAVDETKAAILTATNRVAKAAAAKATWGSIFVTALSLGIPFLLLAMIALRHPFIGRRLLIMVPTLLAISVIVFAIIQLPPGDFLSTKIMQIQESGDTTAAQSIQDLKDLFHFEEPNWKLYCRWMGLKWFTSFAPGDEGLLQGNLGRSMETQQPINQIVGDRITLTVIVSLATILFTWAVALPIGIYSAVRQYSLGDYVLTLVGFIGMCVPAFLLALVLIALTGLSGLFSPEFAAQPEWNSAKVMDLLRHVWIPIVVLGVGGTAGMIRVMRANLLDELKKPYVTTAMAKGVRPMRLLLKYPVRLALNPFISGIGGLFPQLISGGAIVAIVLALPMVGPLQLQALMSQDTYMAGSMLMVLSLLGVVGTLVSDLLLLWLDPRIRFEGGSR
ncbi:MAG: ABC transporter substrate-binding protein [Tepidisphaeraceae bacterium]